MGYICYSCNDLTKNDVDDVNVLLKHLSKKAENISWSYLKKVMENGFIFVARNPVLNARLKRKKGIVVGMATLVPYYKLTGHVGIKEDVVVHKDYRSLGIASDLMKMFYKQAKKIGLKYVDFTSNPDRKDAHALYQKIPGCSDRKTICFRTKISN